ncbi:hypothetical protein TNCV_1186101 [Trichonephila clavipes]|nr:hypothetical protein TNCV_1186091 [Trichonephila clavipes]GFW51678.1 hypothetical protein TNCV_1186101 [Trichonephila clavipes]
MHKPLATPMSKDCRLKKFETKNSNFHYRQAVCALMYLMMGTRVRVFRNIVDSVGYGITYLATETKGVILCYSDSDFDGCTKTSRSNSEYVMIYAGGAISHGAAQGKLLLPHQQLMLFIAASEAAKV